MPATIGRSYGIALTFLGAMSLAVGCGTMQFVPSQGPLEIKRGLVPPLTIAGDVPVANKQVNKNPFIVYSHLGLELQTDYVALTEHMINGLRKELFAPEHRHQPGAAKQIGLSVTYMHSENRLGAAWITEMGFQAVLGNGTTVNKTTSNATGTAPQIGMNDCILNGIVQLLNDPAVKTYLAVSEVKAVARSQPTTTITAATDAQTTP